MTRTDKLTAAAGVAACAVCCAPLVLGPLAWLGAVIAAGAGATGVTGAASAGAPGWLLVVLAVITVAAVIGAACTVALLARRKRHQNGPARRHPPQGLSACTGVKGEVTISRP